MPISRQWLSWDDPCLPQAAAWLLAHYARSGVCDLREMICVLPGARAGRLLLADLLTKCAASGVRLHPPRVLTPGAMADEIFSDAGDAIAIAGEFESHLAWIAGLREIDASAIASLLPQPPEQDDLAAWSDLAKTIGGLYETLAGELKDFNAAADAAERMSMASEGERWRAMAAVHELQRTALAKAGLVDRHDARSRLLERAIAAASRSELPRRAVVLIGVSDLNGLQKAALRLISLDVTALVHAPPQETDAFDDLGTVLPDAWTDRRIDIADDQIVIVERPPQQAQAALRFLSDLNGEYAPTQITLGLGDAALLGDLQAAAGWAGIAIHNPSGIELQRSAPCMLLEAAADWIEDQRFEHLASLLRHPDIERWVSRTAKVEEVDEDASDGESQRQQNAAAGQIEWLTLLDTYFCEHLQGRITGGWLGSASTRARLKAVHDAVQNLIAPLVSRSSESRPLQEWCQPILDVLANAYAIEDPVSDDGNGTSRRTIAAALSSIDAALAVRDAISEIATASPSLQPSVTAAVALRAILDHVGEAELPLDRPAASIEALGWLELHLDAAPALAVLGFNDGAVPDAIVGHAFLPDGLRSALGLVNNARRYARDAYLLQAIANSRKHFRVIVGRRSAQGDPLSPSRLLLACDDATLVDRIINFAADRSTQPNATPLGLPRAPASKASDFLIPQLPALPPPTSMRVTEFRQFLECPYRYALERLLRLEGFDDGVSELDPMSFGNLAHAALATLGDDAAIAASDDADAIFAYLSDQLRSIVKRTYGSKPLPAVRLQVARLEQRLRSFAFFQAMSAREGWRIAHCEIGFTGEVALDIPSEEPMPIRGKIDRIDHHAADGKWRVIDYKTSETAKSPLQTHHERRSLPDELDDLEWSDLQLPLYHYLVTRGHLKLPGDLIELGYIVLPKQSGGVELHAAEWGAEHLAHGLERAREVVRAIRRGEWGLDHLNKDIDSEFDAFARICQTTAFKADLNSDDESEGGA